MPVKLLASPLKMGPIGCLETSVTKYQLTLRNIFEERRCQPLLLIVLTIQGTQCVRPLSVQALYSRLCRALFSFWYL